MNKDLVTQQGNALLQFRKTLMPLKEGFENQGMSAPEEGVTSPEIQKDMETLKTLEDEFMRTLSEYTASYKMYMTDIMNVVQSESSKYIGKNIQTNDGVISYISNLGIARSYTTDSYKNKHETCGTESSPLKVNANNVTELKFRKGVPMRNNEPCGYEGKNIIINADDNKIINLTTIPGTNATQQTSYSNNRFPAKNAIDGNMNTFNSTSDVIGTWWQVEFPKNSFIKNIVIHNRKDCCWDRFTTVQLDIFDENMKPTYTTMIQRTVNNQKVFNVDTIHKIGRYVRLTQKTETPKNYLHMAEVQVWGYETTDVKVGSVGYVDGSNMLRPYENETTRSSDPSCPTDSVSIPSTLWDLFKKGQTMQQDSVCDIGNIDINLKTKVETLNKKLMQITEQINQKSNETKAHISKLTTRKQTETANLNAQLERFKELYKKYNNIDKKGYASLGAMMEDIELVQTSSLYTYLMWTLFAIITLYFTIRHLRF